MMTEEERDKLLNETIRALVATINATDYKMAGEFLYIDPELLDNPVKYCSTRPYMSIPFWTGGIGSELKYTLNTNVIGDDIFINITDASGTVVVCLWHTKLSISIVDINVGKLLYTANKIYWNMKLGISTNRIHFYEIDGLTAAAQALWHHVPVGSSRLKYSESLMTGLQAKYGEMLARTELESDAFKQQEE